MIKKSICLIFALAMIAVTVCGCGFNYDKEDLSKYITLCDYENITFDDVKKAYADYRQELADYYSSGTFTVEDGYTLDFKVTAEIVTETKDEDGKVTSTTTKRYEPWCHDTDEDYVKDYNFGEIEDNSPFDTGLEYLVDEVTGEGLEERVTRIGESFSFTNKIPKSNPDAEVAGQKVKYTVTVMKILPGISDEEIYNMLAAFFQKIGYAKDTAEIGDWVMLDYTGKIDGETFEGNSVKNNEIKIGSGTLPKEVEDALIGHKVGDKVSVTAAFDEDFRDKAFAGKTVELSIEVTDIYNADYAVRSKTDFETAWELKETMKALYYGQQTFVDIVTSKSEMVTYPEELLTKYEKYYKEYYYSNSHTDEYKQVAAEEVKRTLVAYSLKKAYDIEYTKKDYADDLTNLRLYYYYYYNQNVTEAEIENMYTKDMLENQFVIQKVTLVLASKVTFKGQPDILGE